MNRRMNKSITITSASRIRSTDCGRFFFDFDIMTPCHASLDVA